MASVARFVSVPGVINTLGDNQRRGVRFDAPGLIANSFPVVFFNTQRLEDPPEEPPEARMTFTARLNGNFLFQGQIFSEEEIHSWHRIVPLVQSLFERDNVFDCQSNWEIVFSDIVIMYHANITSLDLDVVAPPIINPVDPVEG